MDAQNTRLDLDGLLAPETVAELHGLAEEVELVRADFEDRLAELCFRALIVANEAANEVEAEEGYEAFLHSSGTGRLTDALSALANSVNAARLQRPDDEPAWWVKARTELGVNEWGVTESDEQ